MLEIISGSFGLVINDTKVAAKLENQVKFLSVSRKSIGFAFISQKQNEAHPDPGQRKNPVVVLILWNFHTVQTY